jgi:hypothetical protein
LNEPAVSSADILLPQWQGKEVNGINSIIEVWFAFGCDIAAL